MDWIGHVNRMDSKRKVSQVFNNNPQGSRLRGRPKNRWWNCVQILINAKLQIGKRGKKSEVTGRSQLKRRRAALDTSAVEEEEEEEAGRGGEEGEEEEKKREKKCFSALTPVHTYGAQGRLDD